MSNTCWLIANSVDPDQTPRSAASDLGLHCLAVLVCPNTWDKYSINLGVWYVFSSNNVTFLLESNLSTFETFCK